VYRNISSQCGDEYQQQLDPQAVSFLAVSREALGEVYPTCEIRRTGTASDILGMRIPSRIRQRPEPFHF
jgi:hypothetical protein